MNVKFQISKSSSSLIWHSSLLEKQFRITDKRVGLTELINLDWLTATLTDVFLVFRNKVNGLARCGDWTSGSYYSTFFDNVRAIALFCNWIQNCIKASKAKNISQPDTHHIFDHVYRCNDFFLTEQLQIANYGIGGHYEPHFDHARDEEDKFSDLNLGNRIATVLFYVSHFTDNIIINLLSVNPTKRWNTQTMRRLLPFCGVGAYVREKSA